MMGMHSFELKPLEQAKSPNGPYVVSCRSRLIAIAVMSALLVLGEGCSEHDRVLRVGGIVVVDANGRERVLIGAPLELPSSQMGGEEDAQKAYGIAINDEAGMERIVLSAPQQNPRVKGKVYPRRMNSYGITLHDSAGNERGGMGYGDDGSVVVMTDHEMRDGAGAVVWGNGASEVRATGKTGLPSISLAVRPDGFVGLYIVDGSGQLIGEISFVEDDHLALVLRDAAGKKLPCSENRVEDAHDADDH